MLYNKIIFLDIDGCVNIPKNFYESFDLDCLENLRRIIKETGAKIVVSSSWRAGCMELTKESLAKGGFPDDLMNEIVGETIRGYHYTVDGSSLKVVRGNEIGTWVDRNLKYPWHENPKMKKDYETRNEDGSFKKMKSNEVGKDYAYVILDDDTDFLLCQQHSFINCDEIEGLTSEDADKAIKILNKIDLYNWNTKFETMSNGNIIFTATPTPIETKNKQK